MKKDLSQRFLIESAHTRGVIVKLDQTWREICELSSHPAPVDGWLAQILVASCLFAANLKHQASVLVQLQGKGALKLLVGECSDQGVARAMASLKSEIAADADLLDTCAGAVLAITLEPSNGGKRYQGLVPLEDNRLARVFEAYFDQSEQLSTKIMFAVGEHFCAGMLIQQMPAVDEGDADGFNRISHLFATLTEQELGSLDLQSIVQRLFHEEDVRLFESDSLRFGCRCSRQRVAQVLLTLGEVEAMQSIDESGSVIVNCEFCNASYSFDPVDVRQLFSGGMTPLGSSTTQ